MRSDRETSCQKAVVNSRDDEEEVTVGKTISALDKRNVGKSAILGRIALRSAGTAVAFPAKVYS